MELHIIAAIVDVKELTLYLIDGSTKKIPQGNPELAVILEKITPQLLEKKVAVYKQEEPENNSEFIEFSVRSTSGINFYKIPKEKLSLFLANSVPSVTPVTLGDIPKETSMTSVINEIIANAEPVTEDKVGDEDSVIAVVDDKIIPDANSLLPQIIDANERSSKGLENFMKRVASVADKRMHSVQDLMKFMEKGDLPIAEDGSIIIYKILKKAKTGYVDCHTKNVPQKVGSYVYMGESLVDHNRNNECSNGLHVARRGYLGQFSGDVCVLAKVKPEDVIAVPQYDANKMRVSGYHILFELSEEVFKTLRNNKPLNDCEDAKRMLGKAIIGDHVGVIEEVKIGANNGGNITVTQKMTAKEAEDELLKNILTSVDATAKAISTDITPTEKEKANPVLPLTVTKDIEVVKDTISNLSSRKETAKVLYAAYSMNPCEETYADLLAFKQKCKCSWEKLGVPIVTEPKTANKNVAENPPTSRNDKAKLMLKNIKAAKGQEQSALVAELVLMKRKWKVSYTALGFTDKDIALITRLSEK